MQLNDNRSNSESNNASMKSTIKTEKAVAGTKQNSDDIYNGKEIAKSKAEERQEKLSKS